MFPTLLDSMPKAITDPFPYVVVHDALPAELYARLEYDFPSLDKFIPKKKNRMPNNRRFDLSSKHLKQNGVAEVWQAFVAAHTSQRFWAQLWGAFGTSLQAEFPGRTVDPAGTVAPRWTKEKAEIRLDAALGVNTPVVIKGSVRRAHVDQPTKMIAGLFYLPMEGDRAGGDLVLYRKTAPLVFTGKNQVKNLDDLEAVVRVPYQRNTAVFYINTPRSIHGVTEREVTPLPRRLVAFACCWRGPMFERM